MRQKTLVSMNVLLIVTMVLAGCVTTTTPTTSPSLTPTRPAIPTLVQIPDAAWLRGIGIPYDNPGAPKVNYPMIDDGPWGGVPLGGLGTGSIGRTYGGDFARWHLDLGRHRFENIPVNQFSVFVAQEDNTQAHVLSALRPSILREWNWDMPTGAGRYYALFPKAWFVYDWDALPVHLVQEQFSPIIPGNYRESSYPAGIFKWTVENPTNAPLTLGLMFSWQNLVGHDWRRDLDGNNYNYGVTQDGMVGIVLTRPGDSVSEEWDGSFAIVAAEQPDLSVTYRTRFPILEAADVWNDFSADGRLDNVDDHTPAGTAFIAAALAVTVELEPGEVRTIPFVLAWDFPITEFGLGTQWYKRYTKFFGITGRNAWAIAGEAVAHYPEWETAIDAWQQPILDEPSRPDWYKSALFNELYYLVDGGTIWENGRVGGQPPPDDLGRFAYLECFDYAFYNTFDVHFYASFALIQLWPDLQEGLIRDFAAAVPLDDAEIVQIGSSGAWVPRKQAGAVPHDIGSPTEDPWLRVNAYNWQNINIWKDLNSKFVLQLWRDYVFTGDQTLVEDCWPAVVQALDYLHRFDRDGDGLPEHDGVPDQTYDTWPMSGASAYGGSLWLAALEAAVEMGKLVGNDAKTTLYSEWLESGKASFEQKLWNGEYYDFDSSGGAYSDSIMADQLVGQWYADATGLAPVAPPEHILSALQKIYQYNVRRFANGEMGAVNGMRPDGQVDTSGEQSQEVWTGTTYALAAFMLHRGLMEEAWTTGWGVYNVTYNRGYWFRTPEAYNIQGDFRASMYMRPLAIWAMEYALKTQGQSP